MQLEFVKLNGLGNDFIFVDNFSQDIELSKDQVVWLCDRFFGIGADGVILVEPSDRSECAAYMNYINSDGSLAEMCGNGVRCFAKYLVDRGYVSADAGSFTADTLAGPRFIRFETDENELLTNATVDMGMPILEPTEIPTTLAANATTDHGVSFVKETVLASPWGDFAFTCISMGNPHAICFIDDFGALSDNLFFDLESKHSGEKSLKNLHVDLLGAYFGSHEVFPEKANIEFVQITGGDIRMRVFERGVGETLACGTGACAVSVAATLTGRTGCSNDIHLRGGILHIEWTDDDHVLMTGAAAESYTGNISI